jgi:hypothetical protein
MKLPQAMFAGNLNLGVMNHNLGKNLSICLFKGCSHQEFLSILHSFPFLTVRYSSRAVYSGHKLATTS